MTVCRGGSLPRKRFEGISSHDVLVMVARDPTVQGSIPKQEVDHEGIR